jgi:hypothetical protein
MCGRYKRPGNQKIAEAFAVNEGLEAFDLEPETSGSQLNAMVMNITGLTGGKAI